ncbi:MAG: CPBP family intramembrane metalloprotease [Ruminococcaceae bacterium]|nr:CPBP family intramembrane metalloprotease [Oscillospiraceae bacterium]
MKKQQKKAKNFIIALAYVVLYYVVSFAVGNIYFWWLTNAGGLSSYEAQITAINNTCVLTVVTWALCCWLYILIGKMVKEPLKNEIVREKNPPIIFLMASVLAVGCRFLVVAYYYIAQKIPVLAQSIESAAGNNPEITTNWQALMWICCIALIAPFFEELLFRVLVMGRLLRIMRPWAAIVLQASAFGALHGVLFQSIFAFVVGIALGIVYYKTKNIKTVTLCHSIFNLSASLMQENITMQGALVFTVTGLLLSSLSLFYIVNSKKKDN